MSRFESPADLPNMEEKTTLSGPDRYLAKIALGGALETQAGKLERYASTLQSFGDLEAAGLVLAAALATRAALEVLR